MEHRSEFQKIRLWKRPPAAKGVDAEPINIWIELVTLFGQRRIRISENLARFQNPAPKTRWWNAGERNGLQSDLSTASTGCLVVGRQRSSDQG
jgi:hypothetical protein